VIERNLQGSMRRLLFLAVLVALWAPAPALGASCPANVANRLETGDALQLVTVVAQTRRATRAQLRLWRMRGECWVAVTQPWTAWVGGRGVNPDKREGDRTTPAGAFGFDRTMYGIAANPGVRYRYRKIVCGDWWVEDPRSRYYNRFFHAPCGAEPPFARVSDDMSRSPTAYRHLAVIDYNMRPTVPGRGSGIFLHASTGRPTLGCISLPVAQLLRVLRWLDPARRPMIAIGTLGDLSRL
jgi:L,D-peptidoglycan transpeptidase YkuD (ErfK/YbiS/YcfS/YnhG family)